MKRVLVVAMVMLCFAGMSVSAAGTKEGGTKPKEIGFWSLFTGGDGEFFDAMIKAFNSSQQEIVMKTDTVKFTDYYTKLTAALAAKTAPNVVVVHQSQLINYVPNNVFVPLDPYLRKVNADLADFAAKPLAACTFDGKIYAIPLDVHPLIMYYNKDLFAKAGISSVPESLEDVVNAAKSIQEKTGAIGIAIDNTTATYKAYTLTRAFLSFLMQQGVTLLNETNTRANFNNTAGAKAIQALIDFSNKYMVTPKGLDYDSSVSSFKLGKAGIHFNGVWATGAFEEQQGLNFGAVQFPAAFGTHAAWADSHTFVAPVQKITDDQTLTDVANFMMWMTAHGEMWAKAGHIPTRESVRAKPEFQNLPYRKDYADAVKYVFAPPRTPKWGEIYDTLSDLLEAAVAKNMNANEALSVMEQKVNDILSK